VEGDAGTRTLPGVRVGLEKGGDPDEVERPDELEDSNKVESPDELENSNEGESSEEGDPSLPCSPVSSMDRCVVY
jgi:hypothetical protein